MAMPMEESSSTPISIDGGVMEGGGQILRNAVALSCLLRKPITVTNIRGNRSNPGLRPQHLTGMRLVCELCNGKLTGDKVGSTTITFYPGTIKAGNYVGDTQTAGSICLLMQVSLPCLFFASEPSDILFKGGTNADFAPPVDYYTEIFLPVAEKMGIRFGCDINMRGFYPKGGGEVKVNVTPLTQLKPIQMTDFGRLSSIKGRAFVAGSLPVKVAHMMAKEATRLLRRLFPSTPTQIDSYNVERNRAVGTGSGILIVAETSTGCLLSGSGLGKKGIPAEKVAADAVDMLTKDIECEACVDEHLQDQLILFMALASGKSSIRTGPLSLHTETAIYIAQLLTQAKFTTTKIQENGSANDTFLIECEGIGLKGQH